MLKKFNYDLLFFWFYHEKYFIYMNIKLVISKAEIFF